MPEGYNSLDGKAPFAGMSGAYKLARLISSLQRVILPNDCPDDTPPPVKPPNYRPWEWDADGRISNKDIGIRVEPGCVYYQLLTQN